MPQGHECSLSYRKVLSLAGLGEIMGLARDRNGGHGKTLTTNLHGSTDREMPPANIHWFPSIGRCVRKAGQIHEKKGISTQRDKVAKGIVRNSCHLVRHLRRKRPQISFNKYKARRVTLNRRRQLNNKHVTAKPKDQNEKNEQEQNAAKCNYLQ